MSPRGRPRAFDRDAALDAAMYVFWERGYEGTSMADLTAAMGINSPSLYAAFGGKESLFHAAVERYGQRYGQEFPDRVTAREAVAAWLGSSAKAFTDRSAHPPGCMIVLAGVNCTQQNRRVREFLAEKRRNNLEKLRARLARGVLDGDIPENVDLDRMVTFYGTVLHGLSIQALDGATERGLAEVIDVAMASWKTFQV
ncbi:TetR/AcrR family transcriptional regulator [Amycolatopsis taiwanensis]|uniref:TetR family transcriptional regulator n=1 Tax=Amycolatopsis taiwanensis TaxID=342230 RepID=A0A9W6VC67_9PSEU|nr:TetR/AcrR family transcriptional regulator [Amycolatopsis taiwanensis]GLY63470.1 TetR family transcriptional regulator [Amycolatopsis taiwanensis]